MKIMGLDLGDSTIGIAVSDERGFIAFGRENYRRISTKKDLELIMEYIINDNVDIVVFGKPLNMNGTLGPQGEKVLSFMNELEKKLKYSNKKPTWNVKIDTWDERLTTVSATKHLISADVSRSKRKEVIDKLSAVFILQDYLDKKNIGGNNNESQP
jgi:putative Holliday junction resolvase